MFETLNKLNGKTIQYNKNTVICNEGEECQNIYLLIEGELKIYTYSFHENIYVIRTIKEKEVFASQLLFASNNKFLGNIIANKKSVIKIISKDTFLNACLNDKQLFIKYLNNSSDNYMKLQNRLKVLSQKSIREKILFLLEQKTEHKNIKKIYINSKNELADYLNIPRPSLSRELIKLQNDGIITYSKHYIELKKDSI